MANVITLKVDVRRLDKARFFEGKPDKDGHRPLYADLVLIPRREVGQYGDSHLVKQSRKKDENVELPIIGSATERINAQYAPATPPQPAAAARPEDDVPF